MGLSSLLSRASKKEKQPDEFLLAVQLGENTVKAAIWEHNDNTVVKQIANAPTAEEAINQVLAKEKVTVTKVIFGLLPEHVDGEKISDATLPKLKAITSQFSLKPLGFVVVPEAIAHYMASSEETPPTAILVAISTTKLVFSLFRIGVCKDVVSITRTTSIYKDFEQGIAQFVKEEVLPSKIILYDDGSNLEDMKEELLSYPWQKNDKFLHVPKIELLTWDYSIKAVIQAGVSEMSAEDVELLEEKQPVETKPEEKVVQPQEETKPIVAPVAVAAPVESHLMITEEKETHLMVEEQPEVKDTLGFVAEKDIAKEETKLAVAQTANEQLPQENMVKKTLGSISGMMSRLKPSTSPLTRPSITSMTVPSGRNKRILVAASITAVLGIFLAIYFYPSATIALIADPEILNKRIAITLNTSITTPNIGNQEIPGKVYTVSVSGDKSKQTTGKKTIGEKATGEVTVYNKTNGRKSFKKGSVLTGPGSLKFTLDADVEVASASDTGTSLEYGKTSVKTTAVKLGPTGNIKSGSDFQIDDLPTASFIAKNDKDFAGGTEREIDAVAKEDQSDLLKNLTDELKTEAKEKLQAQLEPSEKFLDQSLKENIVEKIFDKDVGQEADNVALKLTLEVTQTAYKDDDLYEFLNEYVKNQVPADYEFEPDKSSLNVASTEIKKDGSVVFTANYHAFLLPKIDTDAFRKKVAGKSISQLAEVTKSLSDKHIIGYQLSQRKLPVLNMLPFLDQNIQVKVIPY